MREDVDVPLCPSHIHWMVMCSEDGRIPPAFYPRHPLPHSEELDFLYSLMRFPLARLHAFDNARVTDRVVVVCEHLHCMVFRPPGDNDFGAAWRRWQRAAWSLVAPIQKARYVPGVETPRMVVDVFFLYNDPA